jgi:hypothetical protein
MGPRRVLPSVVVIQNRFVWRLSEELLAGLRLFLQHMMPQFKDATCAVSVAAVIEAGALYSLLLYIRIKIRLLKKD